MPPPAPPDYARFAHQLYDTNIISDPWLYGNERFRLEPVVLDRATYTRLSEASEALGRVFDELARTVWAHPELLDDYYHLTPYQKAMWLASGGEWHGIARLDLFMLGDGTIRFCEMNSDTPSGEAEAVITNEILHPHYPTLLDPNQGFRERFCAMAIASCQGVDPTSERPPNVGILYPTDLPEDLSMIALYREWFTSAGCQVVLGSPYNIHVRPDGGIALFDLPIDLMIRHYKTDWWGERIPVWLDAEEFNDPDPLDPQILHVLEAEGANRLAVVNPFGSVVTQNKLSMALLWERIDLFSEESQATIRAYLPPTWRLDAVAETGLKREEWVLKSDYGCEGDEVVIGRDVTDEIWDLSFEQATPNRWIVQEFFDAAPTIDGMIPNYGVYLIGGETSGIFTRLSAQATDYTSVVAPTFIEP